MSWWERAACRGLDPGPWFPLDDRLGYGFASAVARRICAGCPVRVECLAEALADPTTVGVWGGTNEMERRAMRRVAEREPRLVPALATPQPPVTPAFHGLEAVASN